MQAYVQRSAENSASSLHIGTNSMRKLIKGRDRSPIQKRMNY
jgi:hypothetical protein